MRTMKYLALFVIVTLLAGCAKQTPSEDPTKMHSYGPEAVPVH